MDHLDIITHAQSAVVAAFDSEPHKLVYARFHVDAAKELLVPRKRVDPVLGRRTLDPKEATDIICLSGSKKALKAAVARVGHGQCADTLTVPPEMVGKANMYLRNRADHMQKAHTTVRVEGSAASYPLRRSEFAGNLHAVWRVSSLITNLNTIQQAYDDLRDFKRYLEDPYGDSDTFGGDVPANIHLAIDVRPNADNTALVGLCFAAAMTEARGIRLHNAKPAHIQLVKAALAPMTAYKMVVTAAGPGGGSSRHAA